MYIRNERAFNSIYIAQYIIDINSTTTFKKASYPSPRQQEYFSCLSTTRKRDQVMTRTKVCNALHIVIAIIQGSTPASHLDIAVAWSRVIRNFVVLAKGETHLLVAFFGSTCSIVASIISVIWKLIGKLYGPCHISVLDSETKIASTRKRYTI